jgi:DNA (cytosine-5)-methyltransferase 1
MATTNQTPTTSQVASPTGSESDNGYVRAVDLCAGCGGFSLGLQQQGFNVRSALEIDPVANATYREHIGQGDSMTVPTHDIREVKPSLVPQQDKIGFIAAGPPCQTFSTAQGEIVEDELRESVAYSVVDWFEALEPRAGVIENVAGLKDDHPEVLATILEDLRDIGYQVHVVVLAATEYCVPQARERMFVMAVHEGFQPPDVWKPPACHTGGQHRLGPVQDHDEYLTASDALGDLPEPLAPQPPAEDPVHLTYPGNDRVVRPTTGAWVESTSSGYERGNGSGDTLMPPNHMASDHSQKVREDKSEWPLGYCGTSTTDRRLHPDEPAPTMTGSQGTPPVHYVGQSPENPDGDIDAVRRLTPREVARLQTFPNRFGFGGTREQRYQMAANAVPVRLAEHVAGHLREAVW